MELETAREPRGDRAEELLHPRKRGLVVDADRVAVVRQQVANAPEREVELAVQQRGRGSALLAPRDARRQVRQVAMVRGELLRRLPQGGRARDEASGPRKRLEQRAQALALRSSVTRRETPDSRAEGR